MLRRFRLVAFWLALVALSLQGFAAAAAMGMPGASMRMASAAAAAAMHALDQMTSMSHHAAHADAQGQPDCPPGTGCGDPRGAHCMATPACSPFIVANLTSSLPSAAVQAIAPSLAVSGRSAAFLTGAPERPPRSLA